MNYGKDKYRIPADLIYEPVAEHEMLPDIFIHFFRDNSSRKRECLQQPCLVKDFRYDRRCISMRVSFNVGVYRSFCNFMAAGW